jgi:hypothetical protein
MLRTVAKKVAWVGRTASMVFGLRETSEEVSAACPGETPYTLSNASTATRRRTEAVRDLSVLEGERG